MKLESPSGEKASLGGDFFMQDCPNHRVDNHMDHQKHLFPIFSSREKP